MPKWRDFAKSGHTAVEGERNKGVAKTNTLKRRCKVLQRWTVWPDLARFRHFGKNLKVFGHCLNILGDYKIGWEKEVK